MFVTHRLLRGEKAAFVVGTLGLLIILLGCRTPQFEPPSAMLIQGVEPLNVNEQGDSIPVNVRILALSSRNNFDQAVRDFDALWGDAAGLLGDELLAGPQEATVFPGGPHASPRRLSFQIDLPEQTRYVAVLALFHTEQFESERRRYEIVPIEEIEQNVIVLTQARIESVALDE